VAILTIRNLSNEVDRALILRVAETSLIAFADVTAATVEQVF